MINENIVWKEIPEYEGFYLISNTGSVKSLYKGIILYQHKRKDGYMTVCLSKNAKVKTHTVHSLMAITFLDKNYLKKGLVVDHIDDVKSNNCLKNLRITTHRKNIHKFFNQNKGSSKHIGVHFCNTKKKFISLIMENKKVVYLGSFNSEEEAKNEYDKALECINKGEKIIPNTKPSSDIKGVYFHSKRNLWVCQYKGIYYGSSKDQKIAENLSITNSL